MCIDFCFAFFVFLYVYCVLCSESYVELHVDCILYKSAVMLAGQSCKRHIFRYIPEHVMLHASNTFTSAILFDGRLKMLFLLCLAVLKRSQRQFSFTNMTERKHNLLLLRLFTSMLKENVASYDVDAVVRGVETEVNAAVTQGVVYAQRKISSITKRLSQR